jgi:hypothetical chaperone protein
MSEPIAYGIDFGTTNSAIAVAYPDSVSVIDVEQEDPTTQLPSIVYLHRDGLEAAGTSAVRNYLASGSQKTRCGDCSLVMRDRDGASSDCHQYRRGSGCNDSRLLSGLKEHLADRDLESTHSWARDFEVADLVAIIIRQLKATADRALGADVRRAVLGHPVNYPGTEGGRYQELQDFALGRLVAAAERAGFDEVVTFPEPAAALVDERLSNGTVLALDFGGGTFDAAIVRFRGDEGEVVALQGANIGGTLFDAELFKCKVEPFFHLADDVATPTGSARIPAYIRNQLRTMSGAKFLLNDSNVPAVLRDFRSGPYSDQAQMLEEILFGGHVYAFYRAIESAKIQLSAIDETTIELHRPGIDISIPVTRSELENEIEPHLRTLQSVILKTFEQAQIAPEAVDGVIRTGGSSSVPMFVEMLAEMIPEDRIQSRDPFDTVVHGLGSQARLVWGS